MIDDLWRISSGTLPILLSAPHNYTHLRNGIYKVADSNTGRLVDDMVKKTHIWSIVTTAIQRDPNFYPDSLYRIKLKDIVTKEHIKVVIDIHGRKKNYPYLMEVMPNKSFKALYAPLLTGLRVTDFINPQQLQITRDLNIPAIQIEIRRDGREPGSQTYDLVLSQLETLILKLINA